MHSSILTYLKEALRGELSGLEAHQKMLPSGRRLQCISDELSLLKQSSVLLLLFPEGEQIYICLIKRPSTMKHHPGQISFPGGRFEEGDDSPERTALREAQEEIGINPSCIRVLGKLSELYVEVSQFSIHPFLAWANQRPEFLLNASEVEELILFPLTDFIAHETIMETDMDTISGLLRVKYYPINNEVIWGATAMILSELIEIMKRHQGIASRYGII